MPDNFPSDGHKPCLQFLVRSTLDPFCWGGPINIVPEIEVCGGGVVGYSVRRIIYTSELPVESLPVQPLLSGASLMVARVILRDG